MVVLGDSLTLGPQSAPGGRGTLLGILPLHLPHSGIWRDFFFPLQNENKVRVSGKNSTERVIVGCSVPSSTLHPQGCRGDFPTPSVCATWRHDLGRHWSIFPADPMPLSTPITTTHSPAQLSHKEGTGKLTRQEPAGRARQRSLSRQRSRFVVGWANGRSPVLLPVCLRSVPFLGSVSLLGLEHGAVCGHPSTP